MARASVYAAPALYEPFGLAILEAASAGCALLLGDIPSLRELWDGVAVFAPPRDQSAFARALRLLEGDPRGRRALAAAARQRACRFTSAAQADAYIALARELAAERGASSVSLALGATSCA
mgnify:FL=1